MVTSPDARYEAKVDRSAGPDACHPWTGATHRGGYGNFWNGASVETAHRWAFRTFKDQSLRSDEVVRHTCDNPPCQNLNHLIKGTKSDNMKDAVQRGQVAIKTHCKHGHEYNEENTYYRPDRPGARTCRACNNEGSKRYYPKRGHKSRRS